MPARTEHHADGQAAFAFEVFLETGQVTGLEFGEAVEHDACDEVLHEGIAETVHDHFTELLDFFVRQIQGFQPVRGT